MHGVHRMCERTGAVTRSGRDRAGPADVGARPARWAHRVVRVAELMLVAALAAGVVVAVTHATGGGARGSHLASSTRRGASVAAAAPLRAAVLSPAAGQTGVAPTATVTVRFSAPLAHGSPMPRLQPPLAGSWRQVGPLTWDFAPDSLPAPLATETLVIPAGTSGVRASDGGMITSAVSRHWRVRDGSVLGLQQALATLGYLPLRWVPTTSTGSAVGSAGLAAFYEPPSGRFSWRYPDTPASLEAAWAPGVLDRVTVGAMVAFERHDGLPAYTSVRPQMWTELLAALSAHRQNPDGYTYAEVSQTLPESLTLWHDGQDVYTAPVNTGINSTPTPAGTFFVYSRFASTTMQGQNPNGSYYDDHGVRWVNYFDGGVAIHGFIRASYGFPQSLGCVELPVADAAVAWKWIHYGTIVTVASEPPATRAASA